MTMDVLMWPARSNRIGNPYNSLLADELERSGASVKELSFRELVRRRHDIVHVHWPEWALQRDTRRSTLRRGLPLLLGLRIARRRGAAVVWTVHNLDAHDRRLDLISRLAWHAFWRTVDATIALSTATSRAIQRRRPDLPPPTVIPHGHYRDAYPEPPARSDARLRLGWPADATALLFVGQLRPYKGVTDLIAAVRGSDMAGIMLHVAGRADHDQRAALIDAGGEDPRITFSFEHVPAEDLSVVLAASDVVVLPFRQISTSGSALLALSFGRPVMVPRAEVFDELAEEVGDAWVRRFDPPLSASVLAHTLASPLPLGSPALEAHGWDRIATATLEVYRSARSRRGGSSRSQ